MGGGGRVEPGGAKEQCVDEQSYQTPGNEHPAIQMYVWE